MVKMLRKRCTPYRYDFLFFNIVVMIPVRPGLMAPGRYFSMTCPGFAEGSPHHWNYLLVFTPYIIHAVVAYIWIAYYNLFVPGGAT